MDKKKVLIVITPLRLGGVQVMAVNLQKYLPEDQYERSFYIIDRQVERQEEELKETGIKIIHRPEYVHNMLQEYRFLKCLMRQERYDIVHCHLFYYSGMVMRAAEKAGVPKRFAHGHMTQWIRKETLPTYLYHMWMRRWLQKYTTIPLACSEAAGEYLFGTDYFQKHGTVLNNGIDLAQYTLDPQTRAEVRMGMNVADKLVIGHVGNLYHVKNQMFILDVFSALAKRRPEAVLWLIGEGEQKHELEEKTEALGLESKVFFLGVRSDVPHLMQAMDVLIFPSLFEGVPLVPVEAQGADLPCLLSDRITDTIHYQENVAALSLDCSPKEWSQKLEALAALPRTGALSERLIADYDLQRVTARLETIYER